MPDAIEIAINVITDAKEKLGEVGRAFEDIGEAGETAGDRLDDLRSTMAGLIAQERLAAQMQEAADAVSLLTKEEKDAVVQAEQLAQAEREAAEATEGFDEEVQGFSFTEFNQGIEVAKKALQSLKQVWDFAKEGAGNIRIANQFSDAMQEIGINADVLLDKLDAVADRTVDDEAIMQVATRAFTNELVGNQDELVRLFEIARAASVRFGGDTASAFESIAEATEVGTARSLKSVGILVDFDKVHKDFAKSLGKTSDQLTIQEAKQARLNAVLEAGAGLVVKVGDSADDQLTKLQQFEQGADRVLDSVKELAATIVVDVVDAGDQLLNREAKLVEGLQDQEDQAFKTSDGYQVYSESMQRAAKAAGFQVDAQGRLIQTTIGLGGPVTRVINANFLFSESVFKATQESKKFVDIENLRIQRFIAGAAAADAAAAAEERLIEWRGRIADATATAGERAIEYTKAEEELGALEQQLADLDIEIAERGERRIVIQQASTDTVNAHAEASLRLQVAQQDLAEVTRREGESDAEFGLRQLEATQRVSELTGHVGELSGKLGDHAVAVGGATKAQQENREAILGQIAAFKEQQEVAKATELFKALGQALRDKKIDLDEYKTSTQKLNDITGLYTDSALKAAVKQEELLAIIGDADSTINDITGALDRNKMAIDGIVESTDKEKEATEKSGEAADKAVPKFDRMERKITALDEAAFVAADRMVTLRGTIDELEDKTVTVTVKVNTVGQFPTVGGETPYNPLPSQRGLDYLVPAGFPNDSMFLPLAVSTGERVIVQPAGQAGRAQVVIGGDNVYINDQMALAMYYEEKRSRLLDAAQQRMGG